MKLGAHAGTRSRPRRFNLAMGPQDATGVRIGACAAHLFMDRDSLAGAVFLTSARE